MTVVAACGLQEAPPGWSAVALHARAEGSRDPDQVVLVNAMRAGPLERDPFHQALRERVPDALLPWCRGCRSHHVGPGYWRTLGLLGVTWMPAKATYAPAEPSPMPLEQARAELVRRFLRCFGPATPSQLAAWAHTAPAHAKSLFACRTRCCASACSRRSRAPASCCATG